MKAYKVLFFLLFIFSAPIIWSQTGDIDTNTYVVIKSNNQEFIGKILSDDGREILLMTASVGKVYINKSDIKSIVLISDAKNQIINGEYRGSGVFTTRYQFSTNAFSILKGENYAKINLGGPEVHFAVSNNFSVGVMSSWIASPVGLALKYTVPTRNEKVNFGVGTIMASSGYIVQGRLWGGLHWGMLTIGDRKNNITFSAGYSYLNLPGKTTLITPGTYAAVNDGNGNYYQATLPRYQANNSSRIKAPILGIAGLASVGKKASFVMDAMFILGTYNQVNNDQTVNDYFNPITNQLAYTTVSNVTSTSNSYKANLIVFMPGMRFQTSENRAFQVSLSGVFVNVKGTSSSNSFRRSFPLPMCSWYYKF